jgi:hypothetical protein
MTTPLTRRKALGLGALAAALASHRDEAFVRESRRANAATREYTVAAVFEALA